MDRLNQDPGCAELPGGPVPAIDRDHWERIAEDALTRVFRTAGAGLSLPGLDARRPDPVDSCRDPMAAEAGSPEKPSGRQGFRLALTGRGTSFTPSIGACFRFESLRQLTAASGRQLGLKAVIVVRGQVVLLPETARTANVWRSQSAMASPAHTDAPPAGLFPWPSRTRDRSLLGLATLVPQPLDRPHSPAALGPALCPLWVG